MCSATGNKSQEVYFEAVPNISRGKAARVVVGHHIVLGIAGEIDLGTLLIRLAEQPGAQVSIKVKIQADSTSTLNNYRLRHGFRPCVVNDIAAGKRMAADSDGKGRGHNREKPRNPDHRDENKAGFGIY